MKIYLTSSPFIQGSNELNFENGFRDSLLRDTGRVGVAAVFVTSDPDNPDYTDWAADSMREGLSKAGVRFKSYTALDRRNANKAPEILAGCNLVILSGGHVPTQNRFFLDISLRQLLHNYEGVLVGISAGSMNCAHEVYSLPELDGEATDPEYKRYFPGLGLTSCQIIPHQNTIRYTRVDGLMMYEDMAFPDSFGNKFYSLFDGTYIYIADGKVVMNGESWLISEGRMTRYCECGRKRRIE